MSRMVLLHIDFETCQACQRCKAALACRLRAIVQSDPGEPPYLDVERCRDCRVCMPSCPSGAIQVSPIHA